MRARHAVAPVPAESKSHACSSRALTDAEWDLVLDNQGLIRFVIGRWFQHEPFDRYDDMTQDGLFGLAAAARKYDPARGTFANYSVHWIRQAIGRGRGDLEGIDYRAAHLHGAIDRWHRPTSLDQQADRDPDGPHPDTIADRLAEPDPYTPPPSPRAVAAAELVWAHVRTDFETAILEALEDGRGAVQAAVDRGYSRSSAAVAVARLRGRIEATVRELEQAAP